MSEENVEIVRKAFDAFNASGRGELSTEDLAELIDPRIEFYWYDERTLPDVPQHLRGLPEVLRLGEQLQSAWVELTLEPLEVSQAPGGRVLTLSRQSGRGRESGVPVVNHVFHLWTIRDGKVRKLAFFRHRADALEAAGLSEEAMSEENVELVRQGYEAWNRGDLEWLLGRVTSKSEFRPARLFPDTDAAYWGQEGFTQFWNTFREPWATFLIEVERIEPIGDDRVLALLWFHGSGRQGVEVTMKFANLVTLEDEMVSQLVGFADWQEALEAAGLRE
jgi:ketosteroid isomerase-like protein